MGLVSTIAEAVFPPSKKQRMFIAAQNGDIATVESLLDAYPGALHWKSLNGDHQTPLMLAAGDGRLEVCRVLIARGAEVDRRDDRGCTAFRHVIDGMIRGAGVQTPAPKFKVDHADLEATGKYLLSLGADINTRCHDGQTPLFRTILGSGDIARYLIRNGADVEDPKAEGSTILMSAAAFKSTSVVEALLEAGASVLVSRKDGKNALDIALESESFTLTSQHSATVALLQKAMERQLRDASIAERERIARVVEESVVAQRPVVLMPQLKFRPRNSQLIGFKC